MQLIRECYRISARFPSEEPFGLTAQLRRAAVSVAANIAEGHGRPHKGAFLNHLSMSRGSLKEVETHLDISQMLGYATEADLRYARRLSDETSRMLTVLRRRLL